MDSTLQPLVLAVLAALGGAFGWLTKQIGDLKKEVHIAGAEAKASNKLHADCEKARYADGLKIQQLQMTAEMLGRATGTTDRVNTLLNPNNPDVKVTDQNIHDDEIRKNAK